MKIFILLLVISIVAAEYKVKVFDDLMKYHDECGAAHYTPDETLTHYKEQKYGADKQSYCHIHCLAKKIEVFDDEYGLKVDNWVAQVVAANNVTEDDVRPKIVACVEEIAQYKDYPCLWAFKGFMCTKKAGYEVIEKPDLSSRFAGFSGFPGFRCFNCKRGQCTPCTRNPTKDDVTSVLNKIIDHIHLS